MAKEWYILQVYTGKERYVEKGLRILMEERELVGIVLDVRSPIEEIAEVRGGRKRVRKKNVLPGYILVQLDLPENNWHAIISRILSTQYVSGFVGTPYGARPHPVSQDEARQFLVLSGEKSLQGAAPVMFFTEGDSVRVVDGPFKSFVGRVDEVIDDRKKLRVMVGIFGRSTPVEVDYEQVEKV